MTSETMYGKEYLLRFILFSLSLALLFVVILGINFLIIPFLLSIVFHYSFHNLIDLMESFRIPRSIAIFLLFFLIGGTIYWILNIYIPPAIERATPFLSYWANELQNPEGNRFVEQIDELFYIDSPLFRDSFPPGLIAEKLIHYAQITVKSVAESLPDLLTVFLITPIISFFLLLDANRIYKYFISMVPNQYFEMTLMVTHKINQQLSNYLKGVFIQSAIMATIASIGFYFLDLNFFLLFGIFLGIANLIPYLGPAIGLVPPAIYALITEGGFEGILPILGVVAICQLIDNVLVQPTVIAKSASLHPILVLVGITVGGNLMGLWGMLIAIPILSILKVTIGVLYRSLKDNHII